VDDRLLKLRILTPAGAVAETECDTVLLTLADGRNGRGGGSVGIRSGHAAAIMALADGEATAERDGKAVLRAHVASGFASVSDDVVTVLSDSAALAASE